MPELVANAPHVHDPAGEPGRVELPPDAGGVRLQRPRRDIRAEAPDVAQQLLAGEDPIRIGGELDEERVLLRRELDLPPCHCDTARRAVDGERPDLRELDARRT